jgi:uncharacterized membrane protein
VSEPSAPEATARIAAIAAVALVALVALIQLGALIAAFASPSGPYLAFYVWPVMLLQVAVFAGTAWGLALWSWQVLMSWLLRPVLLGIATIAVFGPGRRWFQRS